MSQESTGLVMTPAWNGLKRQVLHLAQFGGSIQVLQGVEGAGKTTFFSMLSSEDLGSPLIRLTVDSGVAPDVLFADLSKALGLRPSSSASFGELIASLRGFVQSQYQERTRTVVALDDAHLLTEAALAALISVLQGGSDSGVGLHLIFFAESGLVDLIDSLNLLDVTVHDAQLPSFSPSELKSLLSQYFPARSDLPLIGAEQVHSIWVDSKGLPGKALRLATSTFSSEEESRSLLSIKGLPVAHMAALFLLLSALLFFFLARNIDDPSEDPEALPLDVIVSNGSKHLADDDVAALPPLVQPDRPFSPDIESARTQGEGGIKAHGPKGLNGLDEGVRSELKGLSVKVEEPSLELEGAMKPQVEAEKKSVSQVVLNRESAKKGAEGVGRPSKEEAKTERFEQLVSAVSDIDNMVLKGEKELLSYPGTGYTIQIMALSDLGKLKGYVSKQANRSHLHIYQTQRKGRGVYILLEGFYADRQSSLMAIKNLPKSQRSAGPWPKNLKAIHLEIKENRRI